MLNIGRLAPGGEDYYLEAVASGVEDDYTGAGEAPGVWLTESAAGLDLSGQVEPEGLQAVLAGRDPATRKPLGSGRGGRKVPGFDCTFRAPKSVSLLWGLGDDATTATVRDTHDAAVESALGYLAEYAGYTRRGAGGAEAVAVEGFVAAGFRHRASRAGDPLLHTHVLVANLARTVDDGVWRTAALVWLLCTRGHGAVHRRREPPGRLLGHVVGRARVRRRGRQQVVVPGSQRPAGGATRLATHGDLSRSARHRSHAAYGIGDELRGSFVADGTYWGAAGFLRDRDEAWFTTTTSPSSPR